MSSEAPDWLIVERRNAPLIVSIPHAGADLLRLRAGIRRSVARAQGRGLAARRALRFHRAARGYARAHATFALDHRRQSRSERRLALSRPGDDGALSRPRPSTASRSTARAKRRTRLEIAERRRLYFDPYHAALTAEIARLRGTHQRVALFDAHSIRSVIPRLFEGELPVFNLGTNSGASCAPALRETVGAVLAAQRAKSGRRRPLQGRLDHARLWRPSEGVEAVQLELACRAYMAEPERPAPGNWPTPIDEARAPTRATIRRVLEAILERVDMKR